MLCFCLEMELNFLERTENFASPGTELERNKESVKPQLISTNVYGINL